MYKYNEYIDIAILEFLWTKLGEEVKLSEVPEEVLKPKSFHSFEESDVKHHILALETEGLIYLEFSAEHIEDSVVVITPAGLKTLRKARLLKEACASIEVIYGHLVNNQNNL